MSAPVSAALTPDDRLGLSRARLRRVMLQDSGDLASDALGAWWARSPLRLVGQMGAQAADKLARPIAQRHPWQMVGGALLSGAVLAWARPWRWRWLPHQALVAAIAPPLLARAMAAVNKAHLRH